MTDPSPPVSDERASPVNEEAIETLSRRYKSVITASITINRPKRDVYAFWSNVENLPAFMEGLEAIHPLEEAGRYRWIVAAPGGRTLEWDTFLTEDAPNTCLAWTSVEWARVRNAGRIEFQDTGSDGATLVNAVIAYDPPRGMVGRLAVKMSPAESRARTTRELARLKQLLETGQPDETADPAAGSAPPPQG
ncbi:SRPBCC family protein [uncultured Rhodospira sp.]|uniref:SRPBCC family protein n=1 Tax=uncultured Rhodospira sp. TaxID=1936189 RepID=UPI002627F5B9|nr:SRPBCC family protein [uncultured Rhodospira sp.]